MRRIAEAAGLPQSEVWRQLKTLVDLKVVKPVRKGVKNYYLPNPTSPFFRPMLDLCDVLESFGWLAGKDLFDVVGELGYISGPFAVKQYVQEFWTPKTILLGTDSLERASRLARWFEDEYKIIPFRMKPGARTFKAGRVSVATYEQAIADMLALFESDPYNNALALSSIFYTPFDADELFRAAGEWGVMDRLSYLLSLGRTFGLPLPPPKPSKPADEAFAKTVISVSLRLLVRGVAGW